MKQPTQVFTMRVGRRDVAFTRHAVGQYRARVRPDLTEKQARDDLKRRLREEPYKIQHTIPKGVVLARGTTARAVEYIVAEGLVIPLNKLVSGVLIAPTVMVPFDDEYRARCA